MTKTARYNLKTISLEKNPTTTLIMSICRELDLSITDLELLILDEYKEDWKADGRIYLYLQLPISKILMMNPSLRVNLALKYEWIKQREPLVFNKWYDAEKAEELIKAYDLGFVDVLGATSIVKGNTDNSLKEPLSKYREAYFTTFYDTEDDDWFSGAPDKVMFFKAPTE